jgi:hypothetical protein
VPINSLQQTQQAVFHSSRRGGGGQTQGDFYVTWTSTPAIYVYAAVVDNRRATSCTSTSPRKSSDSGPGRGVPSPGFFFSSVQADRADAEMEVESPRAVAAASRRSPASGVSSAFVSPRARPRAGRLRAAPPSSLRGRSVRGRVSGRSTAEHVLRGRVRAPRMPRTRDGRSRRGSSAR